MMLPVAVGSKNPTRKHGVWGTLKAALNEISYEQVFECHRATPLSQTS